MIRALCLSLLLFSFTGCATTQPPAPAPAPPPAAPEPDDAFSSFGGQIVSLGETVTVRREPVGVKGVRAMIALGKTEWVIHTLPSGKEDKTATANIVVQKGDEAKNLRIQAGESESAYGVTISVIEAGEVYEESSMRWVQFAKIKLD